MNLNFKHRKYLKAFTILEAIITMIISTMVMSLIIGIYVYHQKNLNSYLSVSQNYQESMYFLSILKTDIDKADYVYENEDVIEIERGNSVINYFLNDDKIIRENHLLEQDTFHIQVKDYGYGYINPENELLSNIYLSLQIDVFVKEIQISKTYSNATLFRLNHGR